MTTQPISEFVDTSRLLGRAFFQGENLPWQLSEFLFPSIEASPASSTLRPHNGFGGVISRPMADPRVFQRLAADDPYSLVWFSFGWAPDADRYVANAFRKLVPAATEGRDSLQLALDPGYEFPKPVESFDAKGRFPMGSFPHGGATLQHFGNLWIWGAVSSLRAEEDDVVAGAAARFVGSRVYLLSGKIDPLVLLSRI